MLKDYHFIILGGGSGGLVCAAEAARLQAKAALVEKFKMGGDCLNTGCVPSKAILRSAKLAHDLSNAKRFGLPQTVPTVSLHEILASVRRVQKEIEPHDSVERFESLGVAIYEGSFRFLSPYEISDGTTRLKAKRFVIATGSKPFVPAIPGLDKIPYLTSDHVWDLKELPARLVVLGGGPIGVELAQAFARLGSRVTIVEMLERLLAGEDPEASKLLQEALTEEGVAVLTGHRAMQVDKGKKGFELTCAEGSVLKKISFDQILVAVGRSPNVEGLALEKANVAYSSKRGIAVDSYLRTSAKHIYACGDVCGPYPFAHMADFQARLILRNAFFPGKVNADYRVVPWSTFTDPEIARVGFTEAEAKENNIPHDIYTCAMKDLDRAVCDREAKGFIKVLTARGKDQILGATLVGTRAGEMIPPFIQAMHLKTGLKKLSSLISIYPTLAEGTKRIVDTYNRSRVTPKFKIWLKRYMRWRFG